MNEEARKKLYSQLIQMSESNMKEDAQSIISEEEFNAMSDKEILKYVFEYRDNQTYFEVDGKECIAYIELPDMNLEGQDLSDVHLSKFMLGEVEDNNGYYKISRVSSVNLKDTNATIDLSKIQPNKVSEEYNIKEFSIDFTGSNFNGCDIYGMLPDEYSQGGMYGRLTKEISVIGKEEALDEKYLQRRKEHHLSEEDKKISDRAYEKIINGESLKGMRGVNEKIDLTDYDFSGTDLTTLYKEFEERDIDLNLLSKYLPEIEKADKKLQKLIINNHYEQGDIDFVEKHFGDATAEIKKELMQNHYEQGDIKFIDKHFKELYSVGKREILKLAYEQGDIDFVEKHFEKLWEDDKKKIVETAYERNDKGFVEKYFGVLYGEYQRDIVKLAYEQGDIDFVEKHFEKLWEDDKRKIVETAYERDDKGFVEKYFGDATTEIQKELMQKHYEQGDIKFIDKHFEELYGVGKREILKLAYEQGDIEFVKQRFYESDNSLKEYIAKSTKEPEFVKYFVDKEKEKVIIQGKKEVSASGLMLEEELNMSESELDVDYIKALIDAGINVDFKSYKNVDRSSPEYTPMLYKALQIKDDEKRRAVVESMLRAGVDVTAKYKKIDYYGDGSKETKEVSCLDANDGELVQIMQELGIGMSTKETPNVVHQVQDNKEVVTDFLRSTVRLTDEEIRELENLMSGFGRDLYQESVDNNLQAKKDILDACNATKQGFTKEARILTNDVKILYARLKFFIENQINIIPDRLNTTLGISRKAFDKNYGKYLVEDLEIDDDNYSAQVKKSLLSRYPMPQTREELLKELEMLINREMGEI